MGKVSEMTGTPWHVGYLKMAENDKRRDKRKCRHLCEEDQYCIYLCAKCTSSKGCNYYEETDDGKRVVKKKPKRKNNSKMDHIRRLKPRGWHYFPLIRL